MPGSNGSAAVFQLLTTDCRYGQEGGRAGAGRMIVEGFVDFEYEITLLTVRHRGGTSFCSPIGHMQAPIQPAQHWLIE